MMKKIIMGSLLSLIGLFFIIVNCSGGSLPKEKSLAGVWMGFESIYTTTGRYTPMLRFMVLFEDGTFYYTMPLMGLEAFDRAKSRNDKNEKEYWGTYTFNGASGTWQRAAYDPRPLKLDKDGNLVIGSNAYYRCAPVDGLRLSGAWTTYADPKDPALSRGGEQPIARFAADGKFKDEGLFAKDFASLLSGEDARSLAPGKGIYEIKNFTLTLKYDDGRVRKAAFNLYFKTAKQPSPETIFIYRRRLQRM